MAQPALRSPAYLQPRSKTIPTFSNSSVTASANTVSAHRSRPSSQNRQPSPVPLNSGSETSDKATAALIRKVLCAHPLTASAELRPIEELLPPLTSSNDIDLQLYAIIAVMVKELVYSWYGRITPDQSFVEEVIRIIAHCSRALEERLRNLDLESLVFDEIPELVENHIHGT